MLYNDIDQSVLSLRIESMHQMIASDTLNAITQVIGEGDTLSREMALESLHVSELSNESKLGQVIRAIWDAIKAAVRAVRNAFASVYKAIRDSLRQVTARSRRMQQVMRTPKDELEAKLDELDQTNGFNPNHVDHLRIMGRLEPDVIIKTINTLIEHIDNLDRAFQTAFNVDSRQATQLIEDLIDLARNVDGEKYSNTVMLEEMSRIKDTYATMYEDDSHRQQIYSMIEQLAATTINGPQQLRFKDRSDPSSYYFEGKVSRNVNPEVPTLSQVNSLSDQFLSLSTSYTKLANSKTGKYDGILTDAFSRREREFDRLIANLRTNEQFSMIRSDYLSTIDLIGKFENLSYLRYPSEIIRHALRTILALEKYLMEIYSK